MVDLSICSALPSSGGTQFRQGVRTLMVQASENSHREQGPRYVLLEALMVKLPTLLVHMPCVRQGSGLFHSQQSSSIQASVKHHSTLSPCVTTAKPLLEAFSHYIKQQRNKLRARSWNVTKCLVINSLSTSLTEYKPRTLSQLAISKIHEPSAGQLRMQQKAGG